MSDPGGGRDYQISVPSLPDAPETVNPALADLSPRDKPWDKHRFNADRVEAHYRGSEFDKYAQRVHFCSELLQFGLVQDWMLMLSSYGSDRRGSAGFVIALSVSGVDR
jgi:hypothetical protein